MKHQRGLLAVCALFASTIGAASAADDIVWVTYSQVVKPGDANLTCTQLHAEIDHVAGDISVMDKSRRSIEAALRSAFDMARYGGRKSSMSGQFVPNKGGGGEHTFTKAREEIVSSKKVATERQQHLESLLATCKDPAP